MAKHLCFSKHTLSFLRKVSRQKNPNYLVKNRDEYEKYFLGPFVALAKTLKEEIQPIAPQFHFPQKGIGRLKRPSHKVDKNGGGLFRGWVTYSASRPNESRFETNPNLFFMINSEDKDDPVLVAGGLYFPSSRQTRAIREAIAADASAFDELFSDREFKKSFKGGFSLERSATRTPRGFDENHERIDWIKLQGFFVWRSYTQKQFTSKSFAKLVAKDLKQALRLALLLEKAIDGTLNRSRPIENRFEDIEAVSPRKMDF